MNPDRQPSRHPQRGSATVEQTGLILLLALLFAGLMGALALGGDEPAGKGVGVRLANRISCGPRQPDDCGHHPAVTAYGWPVARLVRYLAPEPMARPGPGGSSLVPVDFRFCQRPSCAVPSGRPGLTTANRRATVFTEVRRVEDGLEVVYWLYRPGLGWEDLHRRAGHADVEAASGTRVLMKDVPAIVPLETLDGRNHVELPPGEAPPWQWKVTSSFGDPGGTG